MLHNVDTTSKLEVQTTLHNVVKARAKPIGLLISTDL